ncbi:aminodeoxychorismate lyase [Oleiagrimonas sp. MCCC 1A03011]|uniref:aminodeoxychorismate lyase n=1 Tax=Oleiagrimonas sp. MCCC 1A03011 TaxID=1926883 RepID=UPI000DC5019F|nr:aminodeoxychorismate lyase [Oleiagrimonas sp. MCCC 1A03011]RAP56322.1 aminodeoxychorismate lyase [Oleiagrimonas sp. MCCC 1A03011]
MSTRCLVNGRASPQVAADDRGLLYGDGLFETLRVIDGRAPLWAGHMHRLSRGCERLGMPAPDTDTLREEVSALTRDEGPSVVRITWTRGRGARGYGPPASPQCMRVVTASPAPVLDPDWSAAGIRVRFCDTRLAVQPALAGLKHLNRLEQVLARAEWRDPDIVEGLMRSMDGAVVCATAANLFARIDGVWVTPSVENCGVAGVARAEVLAQWPQCRVGTIEMGALMQAEEVFLSSSVRGILAVGDLAGRRLQVGADTRAMQAHFAQLLELGA